MLGLRQNAFSGKGAIGKSTTSQNTLASLVDLGQEILIDRSPANTRLSITPSLAIAGFVMTSSLSAWTHRSGLFAMR
ncbi:hypothetical protein X772_36195 [Mesorhizobium sp. LSJC280B00]|nr:hypothetical protein X772_36195 [Mesorhizobium sp. LSJC280B00]